MRGRYVTRALATGAAAGLIGTTALLGMRTFDERYAPLTVAGAGPDPDHAVPTWLRIGGGMLGGVVYGILRRRGSGASALVDGAAIGTTAYAVGALASMPLSRSRCGTWSRKFPEVAGGLLRHCAYRRDHRGYIQRALRAWATTTVKFVPSQRSPSGQ